MFGRTLLTWGVLATLAPSLSAQFVIKLKPATLNAFTAYSKTAEAGLRERWSGRKPFLQLEESPVDLQRVLAGGLVIHQNSGTEPVAVPDGLIHDWTGSVFFPHTSMGRVLALLQDFDAHRKIYPQVADSRVIRRSGGDVTGFWRLEQKGVIPVSFNMEQSAHYEQAAPGKWTCVAHAIHLAEINLSPFARGREFSPDEGHGYLWRFYAYWSLEERAGGVLAESRTLSLSRDVPASLAWAVNPMIQKMPRGSLESTLLATREALNGSR